MTKTPALTSLITRIQKYKELAAFHDLSSQFSMNEVYPEFVLVYRKKTGGKDTRFLFKSIIIWIYSLRKNETYHDAVEKWQSLDIQVKQVAGEPHLNHNHPSLTQHKVR